MTAIRTIRGMTRDYDGDNELLGERGEEKKEFLPPDNELYGLPPPQLGQQCQTAPSLPTLVWLNMRRTIPGDSTCQTPAGGTLRNTCRSTKARVGRREKRQKAQATPI